MRGLATFVARPLMKVMLAGGMLQTSLLGVWAILWPEPFMEVMIASGMLQMFLF